MTNPMTARMERVMKALDCDRAFAAKVCNLIDTETSPAVECLKGLIEQERAGQFGQSIATQAKKAGVFCD